MRNIRTDLAMETCAYLEEAAESYAGIDTHEETEDGITVSRVAIKYHMTAKRIGKPVGNYTTLTLPDLRFIDKNTYEAICKKISSEMKAMLKKKIPGKPILIIGLGNRSITSDSLGPSVIDRLMITRHLFSYAPETLSDNLSSVCAIAPGVLGITGIETEEIIAGVCRNVNPGAVICIDALAARGLDRVTRTVQISDTGIHPGSGVGNNRKEISEKTLGIPVIAIGVPTVVDAATITDDTLRYVIEHLKQMSSKEEPFYQMLESLDDDQRYGLIKASAYEHIPYFMTTPKEIDILIRKSAEVVANGINFALHEGITFEDIDMYVS